jgi:hypothetical protein
MLPTCSDSYRRSWGLQLLPAITWVASSLCPVPPLTTSPEAPQAPAAQNSPGKLSPRGFYPKPPHPVHLQAERAEGVPWGKWWPGSESEDPSVPGTTTDHQAEQRSGPKGSTGW